MPPEDHGEAAAASDGQLPAHMLCCTVRLCINRLLSLAMQKINLSSQVQLGVKMSHHLLLKEHSP